MLAAVAVLGDHLLVALTEQAAQVVVVLQAQQIQQILEHQILVVAALAIPTAQTIQPLDTLAAQAARVSLLFVTPTLLPTSQALAVG
jgi:hypothetical protein